MKKSESIAALAKALAAFQAEVKDPKKDEKNPFFKSKYVALDGLTAAVRPVLAKHGLSYMQLPSGDGQTVSITTILLHESGEFIESEPFTMKPVKADPQSIGSACTYARRYSLQSVLGVAWEEDDDANNASQPPQEAKNQNVKQNTKGEKKATPAVNERDLLAKLQDTAKANGLEDGDIKMMIREHYGADKWNSLTIEQKIELAEKTLEIWDSVMKKLGGAA